MLESLRSDLSGKARPLFAFMLVAYFFIFPLMVIDLVNPLYNPTINRITLIAVPFDIVFTTSTTVDQLLVFVLASSLVSFLIKRSYLNFLPPAASIAVSIAVAALQNALISQVLFFISIPLIAVLLVIASRNPSRIGFSLDKRYLVDITVKFAVGFSAFALVRWVIYPVFPSPIYGDFSWKFSDLETHTFYLLGFVSPALLLAVAFSYVIRYLLKQLHDTSTKAAKIIRPIITNDIDIQEPTSKLPLSPRVLLLAALAASVILPAYPYLPTINPEFRSVSVDVSYYQPWMDIVLSSDGPSEFLDNIFVNISGGDRPLSLLLFYVVKLATGLPILDALKLMPLVLTPALTLITYYFVKTGSRNSSLAAVVAIIVPVSTTVMVGIYAGFYSNWLALIIAIAGLAFLIKYIESGQIERAHV